jgi:hypothetical protein
MLSMPRFIITSLAMMTSNPILKSVNIHEMVALRDEMVSFENALGRLNARIVEVAALTGAPVNFRAQFRGINDEIGYEKTIDGMFWERVLELTQISSIMTSVQIREMRQQIKTSNMPEFNLDNVFATITEFSTNRKEHLAESVLTIFRRLSWDYKTNNPVMFGKKVILSGLVQKYGRDWYHFSREAGDVLHDLNNMMHRFDGKPEAAESERIHQMYIQKRFEEIELPYFFAKPRKNGNCHVTFKPEAMHIVQKMNDLIAEHNPNTLPK